MAVVNELALAIVPALPLDVHKTLLWFVALEPAVIFTGPEFEHVLIGVPAADVGAAVIVTDVVVVNPPQPPDAAMVYVTV